MIRAHSSFEFVTDCCCFACLLACLPACLLGYVIWIEDDDDDDDGGGKGSIVRRASERNGEANENRL